MELFKAMIKVPSELKPSDIQKELKAILTKNEKVEKAYPLFNGMFVFTDTRLILRETAPVNEAAPCHSIPYRSITHFSMAPLSDPAAGMLLCIWLIGNNEPLMKELELSPMVSELHQTLADYVLNKHSPWMNKQLMWKKQSSMGTAKALGFTGAAVLSVLYYKKMTKKLRPVKNIDYPTAAITALIRNKLKG